MEIKVSNVNQALYEGIWRLKMSGILEDSRAGKVLVMPGPVMTTYLRPEQRVLFNPIRDANPVFHLMEAIWMLAGRNDVRSLLSFNSTYDLFAEPDGAVHGAYGHRWRKAFGFDQILAIIAMLKADPNSRQAVLQMWDGYDGVIGSNDLKGKWKDRPCNTHIYFDGRGGKLNMTVCCRSNDMVWGGYGANVVHMSMLQELIAWGVGLKIGVYRQFSNNFHVYVDNPIVKKLLDDSFQEHDYYSDVHGAQVLPMFQGRETVEQFLKDCENMFKGGPVETEFMFMVANLQATYLARKAKVDDWGQLLPTIDPRVDWKIAFNEWAARRDTK